MSELPGDLEYTDEHEWLRREDDGSVTVGITDHAQAALGDLVYVELPEPGQELEVGGEMAVVESVKAASDVYSPVAGSGLEVNEALGDDPVEVAGLNALRPLPSHVRRTSERPRRSR